MPTCSFRSSWTRRSSTPVSSPEPRFSREAAIPYRTFASGDVLTAADILAVTADPLSADVTALEQTTSTSYTDLTTVGPTISSVTLTIGQCCLVIVSAAMQAGTNGAAVAMSFVVSGASTLAASDVNAATCQISPNYTVITRMTLFTASGAGLHTFKAVYKNTVATTAGFTQRRLIVKRF